MFGFWFRWLDAPATHRDAIAFALLALALAMAWARWLDRDNDRGDYLGPG